jgi:hypothetical protein
MVRCLLVVLFAAGSAVGQEKKPDPEEVKRAEVRKKEAEAYLKKYPSEVPELFALSEKSDKTLTDLVAAVKVSDEDSPAVRAAKRALLAENEAGKMNRNIIQSRQFSGSAQYLQLTATTVGIYNAATLIWTDPEKLLPFAECMAAELLKAELFFAPRLAQGVEEPQLGPQLRAARLRSEVTVLQLREQVKKK